MDFKATNIIDFKQTFYKTNLKPQTARVGLFDQLADSHARPEPQNIILSANSIQFWAA